jgi:hypothetical protein
MSIRTALVVGAVGLFAALPACSPAAQWRTLFDGKSLDAWRGYKSASVPDGWRIADGAMTKDGHAGDLITKDQFGDFELEPSGASAAGNSGIFYRGTRTRLHGRPNDDRIYTTARTSFGRPEAADNKTRLTRRPRHGLYPSPEGH